MIVYCKKIVLSIVSLVILTGCISTLQLEKEQQMRKEQQKVYINTFPVQTYEEYLALNKFALDKYLPQGVSRQNGTVYLKDGTKITYYIDNELETETIMNVKEPFTETYKRYYIDSKKLMLFSQSIDSINIGVEKLYDSNGKIKELKDYTKELKAKGMDYKKVLAWAEDMRFLDLKHARVLKGDKFSLNMYPFDEERTKRFENNKDLSERDFKAFTKHKYVWAYIIKRDGGGHYYYVSADGETYLDKGFNVYAR